MKALRQAGVHAALVVACVVTIYPVLWVIKMALSPSQGATLAEALSDLDCRYPGLRFRIITEQDTIRPHIRIFVNETQAQTLESPLQPGDDIYIVCALSGG